MKLPFGAGEDASKPTSLMTGVLSAGTTDSPGGGEEDTTDSKFDLQRYSFRPGNLNQTQKIDFLKDDPAEMTYSRRIALKLMEKSWYYNPYSEEKEMLDEGGSDDPDYTVEEVQDGPVDDFDNDISFKHSCLKTGWAYFEHQALYRFKRPEGHNYKDRHSFFTRVYRTLFMHRNKKFHRAEPGEDEFPTSLYPFLTPHNQLGDFGLGIGLYFSALRVMILVMIICGLTSISNIMYFGGPKYDSTNNGITWYNFFYEGKAECKDVEWIPCPECDCEPFLRVGNGILPGQRCAEANITVINITDTNITDTNIADYNITDELFADVNITEYNETLRFALKNKCEGRTWDLPASNFATVVFMLLSILALGWYAKSEEVKFDEDEQTAQDYSVVIRNPPADANDPDEWRNFFIENFNGAQVTVCTCAVENDLLVKSLVRRRELIRQIHSIRPGKSLHAVELSKAAAQEERNRTILGNLKATFSPGIPELYSELVTLISKVQGLSQLHYPVTNVFLTFETEEDQRNVLEKLSRNADDYKFRRKISLKAVEPEEPSTLRWQELNAGFAERMKLQVYTLLVTIVMLVVDCVVIFFINQWSPIFGTYSISVLNGIFPIIARFMTDKFEVHHTESQKQVSLYFKVVLFQWTNTVLIWFIVLPFTGYLETGLSGLLYRIQYQFLSEIVVTNGMALLDIPGHLNRHYLAPKAKTQDAMNILFQGTPYDLADRYTDLTKLIFLCIFYSSLFPSSFFYCAIGLIVKYQTDKFNLLRTWKRAPALGPVISRASRKYFFPLAVAIMAVVSSYFWTGFPYDNLCENGTIGEKYIGDFSVKPMFPEFVDLVENSASKELFLSIQNFTLTPDDMEYRYCRMNFFYPPIIFPFVPGIAHDRLDPEEYMTADQIISTTYFGWAAMAIVAITLLNFLWSWYSTFIKSHDYKPVGDVQGIPFSKVDSRNAYIPQVNSCMFAYPLIACKIDGLDEELFDFKDPDRTYKYYDLTVDARKLISKNNESDTKQPTGFTVIKHWAPK